MYFDSNVIILFIGDILEKEYLDILNKKISLKQAYISQIVVSEILAFSGYSDFQAIEIETFLYKNFRISKLDKITLSKAAEIIRHKRLETGKKLKLTDAEIAATAIINKKPLLTLDKEDFKNIKDIRIFAL